MIIPVKFGQNPISGLGGDLFKKIADGRTDGHTNDDDGRRVITIAHLEPSAQLS